MSRKRAAADRQVPQRSRLAALKLVESAERMPSTWHRGATAVERAAVIARQNILNSLANDFPDLRTRIEALASRLATRLSLWAMSLSPLLYDLPL